MLLALLLSTVGFADDLPVATDPTADPAPAEVPSTAAPEGQGSFGQILSMFDSGVDLSGYGDVVFTANADTVNFVSTHFNPIIGARLHQDVYAEGEIEFENGGTGVRLEYAYVDWSPAKALSVRAGQFLVPVGEFNERLHPSFRWKQVNRPLMFRSVVPAVWSDTGLQVMGAVESADVRFDYSAFMVNGLGARPLPDGSGGFFDPNKFEPLRDLTGNYDDNNKDKGVGGRLALGIHPGPLKLKASASAYTGAASVDGSDRLSTVDVAWDADAGAVGVCGEIARNYHDGAPLESGMYAEVWGKIGKFTPAVRLDAVRPVPAEDDQTAIAASVNFAPRTYWTVRAEAEVWVVGEPRPTVSVMSAFFF